MRNNLSVSGTEYVLQDGEKLISTSDTAGCIIYANRRFLEVSGYSEDELLGRPHNIIRHPDMPAAAFADLWQTIESGKPWSALVKNRRKNGDFYWVAANVVPVQEEERTVGYMSVRTKPSRAQVAEADELYGKMARGGAGAARIRHGRVVPTGWRALPLVLASVPLRHRLGLALGGQSAIMLLLAWQLRGTAWCALALAGAVAALAVLRAAAAIMQDITLASREQGQGIAARNNAMAELDAIRRQNAALVRQSAGASTSLAQDAASLAQAVSVFKLPGARSSAARRTSPRTASERALNQPSLASASLIDGARSASKLLAAASGNTHTRRAQ